MTVYYVGADPGASGGIAVIDALGGVRELLRWSQWRDRPGELIAALGCYSTAGRAIAHIERVGAWPGQGRSSAFTFGVNAGQMELTLRLSGVAIWHETPGKWQARQRCDKKSLGSDNAAAHKRALVRVARERFPGVEIHADVADALLLAEDARMLRGERT